MKPCPRIGLVVSLSLLSSVAAWAESSPPNVVLLTLDGVMWQDVFQKDTPFKNLHALAKKQGQLFGDLNAGEVAETSNRALKSMPAYQSIFVGEPTGCQVNSCARVTTETLPERIRRELELDRDKVRTHASWDAMPRAVESKAGATFVQAGLTEDDRDPPAWDDARRDSTTWKESLAALEQHRPRFLFISLNDSDEWGHKGDRAMYRETLVQYDQWIGELVKKLDSMGDYGKHTALMITTDHGRGNGDKWKNHGSGYPEAKQIWVYVRGPQAAGRRALAPKLQYFSHRDIRPTIEGWMGLSPSPTFAGNTSK